MKKHITKNKKLKKPVQPLSLSTQVSAFRTPLCGVLGVGDILYNSDEGDDTKVVIKVSTYGEVAMVTMAMDDLFKLIKAGK